MDDIIAKLDTPEECDQFAKNVEKHQPDQALAARRRAVELRAARHGAKTAAEREALQAVYAYEQILFQKHGKAVRASRTWQMIKTHGVIHAVERAVDRPSEAVGYTALVDLGMPDLAFEAVVCRHPEVFDANAVARSKQRLQEWSIKQSDDERDEG